MDKSTASAIKERVLKDSTTNALTASAFFIGALVADALTAREVNIDVPASLRGTSLTLVAMFAAPVIVRPEIGIHGWLQRFLFGALLFAVSLLGKHEGGAMTRAFDAIFLTIVCVSITGLFSLGGVDEVAKEAGDEDKQIRAANTSSCMLAGSIMLYCNLRIMRAGMRHSIEVREFGVPMTNSTESVQFVRGYAHASETATIAVTFGGALGIGAALVMMVHVKKLAEGTGAISLQLGVAGVFQLLAAFAASLSMGTQIENLPALFSETACRGIKRDVCLAATMSRRFTTTNTQAAGLWMSALGMLALAYPPALRVTTKADAARLTWSLTGLMFSLFASLVAFLIVWSNSPFLSHVDYVLVLSLVAIMWSSYVDTFSGPAFYIAGFVWTELVYIDEYGVYVALSHATHNALFFNALILAFHMILVAIGMFCSSHRLDVFTGAVAVAGSSIATGLFTASACLTMGYGGNLSPESKFVSGPKDAALFVLQHFFPFAIWAPIFTCRCEVLTVHSNPTMYHRRIQDTCQKFLVCLHTHTHTHTHAGAGQQAFEVDAHCDVVAGHSTYRHLLRNGVGASRNGVCTVP